MGNIWAVGRDPEYFPDPESFNPQRWLTPDGKLKEDMKSYPFGFGRRYVLCHPPQDRLTDVHNNVQSVPWTAHGHGIYLFEHGSDALGVQCACRPRFTDRPARIHRVCKYSSIALQSRS